MLCLYVGYLLADLAWYNIDFYCFDSKNPTGIFFSIFFASIFAFGFGIVAAPVGIYAGFYAVKWALIFGCAILCSFSDNDSTRRGSSNAIGVVAVVAVEERTITVET